MGMIAQWQKSGNTPNEAVLAATVARQVSGLTFTGSRLGFRRVGMVIQIIDKVCRWAPSIDNAGSCLAGRCPGSGVPRDNVIRALNGRKGPYRAYPSWSLLMVCPPYATIMTNQSSPQVHG